MAPRPDIASPGPTMSRSDSGDNPLDDLPAEIELCKKLKVLDLRHTRLRRVPRELGRLKHLIEIELTDTPLGESLHLTPTSVKVEGAASGVAKAAS